MPSFDLDQLLRLSPWVIAALFAWWLLGKLLDIIKERVGRK